MYRLIALLCRPGIQPVEMKTARYSLKMNSSRMSRNLLSARSSWTAYTYRQIAALYRQGIQPLLALDMIVFGKTFEPEPNMSGLAGCKPLSAAGRMFLSRGSQHKPDPELLAFAGQHKWAVHSEAA